MNQKLCVIALGVGGVIGIILMSTLVSSKEILGNKSKHRKTIPRNQKENISIVGNPGGGDCLFYCFLNAFPASRIGVKTLRKVVADSLTPEQFECLSTIYRLALKEQDRALIRDYSFMKGVKNLDEMKQAVMKSTYYGDEIAVAALEEWSGITPIILTVADDGQLEVAVRIRQKSYNKPRTGYYMLLLLRNVHYENIKYRGKLLLTRNQLPANLNIK